MGLEVRPLADERHDHRVRDEDVARRRRRHAHVPGDVHCQPGDVFASPIDIPDVKPDADREAIVGKVVPDAYVARTATPADGNTASTPSPVFFTTVPPHRPTALRTIVS